MKQIKCLRCSTEMECTANEQIQLGKASLMLGDISHYLSGALAVDIYTCPKCGKIELFQSEFADEESGIAQRTCPKCGKKHDYDYPKCPHCKHTYHDR